MKAWIATYKAGQTRLINYLKNDKRRQGTTITQYLVRCTKPLRPSEIIW